MVDVVGSTWSSGVKIINKPKPLGVSECVRVAERNFRARILFHLEAREVLIKGLLE